MRRIKKKESENLSDTNIRKVINLLSGSSPITKKEACGILNIAYNTARLQRIIDEFEELLIISNNTIEFQKSKKIFKNKK